MKCFKCNIVIILLAFLNCNNQSHLRVIWENTFMINCNINLPQRMVFTFRIENFSESEKWFQIHQGTLFSIQKRGEKPLRNYASKGMILGAKKWNEWR